MKETRASEAKHAKLGAEDRAAAILLRELRDTVKACAIKSPRDETVEGNFEKIAEKYRLLPVKPVLPEKAREFRVRAEYAIGQKQFQDAVDLYFKALKISPWWPEGHFNQALILGEMNCPEEAIAAMNKYIALVPGAPYVRAAKDKIYQPATSRTSRSSRLARRISTTSRASSPASSTRWKRWTRSFSSGSRLQSLSIPSHRQPFDANS